MSLEVSHCPVDVAGSDGVEAEVVLDELDLGLSGRAVGEGAGGKLRTEDELAAEAGVDVLGVVIPALVHRVADLAESKPHMPRLGARSRLVFV
jgi:hypothetical protein